MSKDTANDNYDEENNKKCNHFGKWEKLGGCLDILVLK